MSRRKGAVGEREARDVFRAAGLDCHRTAQSQTGTLAGADITLPARPGLHIEVKRHERLSVDAMRRQAENDAPEGSTPVVAYRRNNGSWAAVVPLEHYAHLVALTTGTDA